MLIHKSYLYRLPPLHYLKLAASPCHSQILFAFGKIFRFLFPSFKKSFLTYCLLFFSHRACSHKDPCYQQGGSKSLKLMKIMVLFQQLIYLAIIKISWKPKTAETFSSVKYIFRLLKFFGKRTIKSSSSAVLICSTLKPVVC